MAGIHGEGEQWASKVEYGKENVVMSRKEKRKAAKKLRRKQFRKAAALKEREEEEARMNDPEELLRLKLKEEEEARLMERVRREFEEKERLWIETMEIKRKAAEQEQETAKLEESEREKLKNDEDLIDDNWEYVEEGPAEIIWQGNEIIVKKKSVRKQKLDGNQQSLKEDIHRPTSNPLPPQSEAFHDTNSTVSSEHTFDDAAQQMPNFGTEQDKAHCPFHFKTGACRFGHRCSRLHLYPDQSCTLLMKNMYLGPGILWEQDEGLEYTDEEVECSFEEFYEDVHTEFLKFGEIVNFKVCKNSSFHLRGNVYVHYKSVSSAMLAYHAINGRYFGGKQVKCEFVCVTRWKVAICGEYMKSRLKTCSHGSVCNFIHCFRNPGSDYEWADWDKPPPKYWVEKMVALFGFSDQSYYDKQTDHLEKNLNSGRTESDYRKNRCRSEDLDFTGVNIEEQWKCRYMEGRNGTDAMGRDKGRMILKEGRMPYKRWCNGEKETAREREGRVHDGCAMTAEKITDSRDVLEPEDHWRRNGKRARARRELRDGRRKDEKFYGNDGDVYDEFPASSLSRSSHEKRNKHPKEKGHDFSNHSSRRIISSKDGRREDDHVSKSRERRKRSVWDEGDRHDISIDGRKKTRSSRDLDNRSRRHLKYDEKIPKRSTGRSCSSGSDMTEN